MEVIALVFVITALVMFFLLVPFSFSLFGLWLSELGLWLSWIPLGMIIYSIVCLVNQFSDSSLQLSFAMHAVSIVFNLVTFVRMLIPFIKIRATNIELHNRMKQQLGEDYLHYVKISNCVDFISCVKFRLHFYFRGIPRKVLNKRIITVQNLIYREINGKQLKLDVHFPNKKGAFPIIIFIHGGGWIIGRKGKLAHDRTCKLLANFGYTVFNINYRLIPIEYLFSKDSPLLKNPQIGEMISDVNAAIEYARKNANLYKGDPSNLFLFGRSAGAHLALLTSFISNDNNKISGVIALYPVTDFNGFYEFIKKHHRLKSTLLTNAFSDTIDHKLLYDLFSPISYVNEDNASNIPPIFLSTGGRDKLVNPEQSRDLHRKLKEFDVPSVLLDFPWANHGFDLVINGPGGQLMFKYLTQFLAWVVTHKTIEQIELLAKEQGLEDVVSKEKIKHVHSDYEDEYEKERGKENILEIETKYLQVKRLTEEGLE
ncbi:MAG: alpha/beta hydrolase [Candidatus Heimdallarchaeota archaeon]|nr:alpha/beta hydrolase [Candidatus Heimdallarchaeota archaeon]